MEFKLNEKQTNEALVFKDICHKIMGYSAETDKDMKVLSFHYIFSNTSGIGQSSAIECAELGIGISLTDYESW